MSDPKGKTPVTRANADAEADDSGDTFENVGFLEESHVLLDKVKTTAENVTTCQNQIEELFYRLGLLVVALKEDSKSWSGDEIQHTATKVEDLMKRCHRQMQRFAIYGRVKAFVHRKELSAWIESFMTEIKETYKSFSTSTHADLEEAEMVPAYEQAKQCDKRDAWEQSREIALYEADVKMILGMGMDAIDNLTKTLNKSVEEMGYEKKQGYTKIYHSRLMGLVKLRLDNPGDYIGESGGARAKREEAEWEYVVNGGHVEETEDEYNPPPRWEPWAAPDSRIASTADAAHGGRDYASVPPPSAGAPVPEEAPPGYI